MHSIALLLLWIAASGIDDPLAAYRQAARQWENEIQSLEELDRTENDPPNALLFTGSSSIRLWESMQKDLEPWPTIRRGFGGSTFSDLAIYAPRLLRSHDYRALVIFVANDIKGEKQDKTPAEIVRLFEIVAEASQKHRPNAPIFLIAITPTDSRWDCWKRIQQANRALEDTCTKNGWHFISTESSFLGQDGKPISDYFQDDRLHLNTKGYQVWSELIRQKLKEVLGSTAEGT